MGASGRGASAPPDRFSATARPDRSLPVLRRKRRRLFRACLTPIGAADADDLLRVLAEAKLGSGEQAVDDIVVAADPVINELGAALGPDHEQGRRFALVDPARERDIDLVRVVERPYGSPRRVVAGDLVAEAQAVEGETFGDDGSLGFARPLVLLAQGDQLIVRFWPVPHGQVGPLGALPRTEK